MKVRVNYNKDINVNIDKKDYEFFENMKNAIVNNKKVDYVKMRWIFRKFYGISERITAIYNQDFIYYAIV